MVNYPSIDDSARLRAVAEIDIELGPEESYNRIAFLIREALRFPSSLISLVDDHKHIYKSRMPDCSCFGTLDHNFCALAALSGEPLIVEDASRLAPFNQFPIVTDAPYLRSYWGVPLKTRAGHNVGTVAVFDTVPRTPSKHDLSVLEEFARLTIDMMELRAHATIDVLTGVHTRRMFEATGHRMFARARRGRTPLSCVLLDVDHFKSINDQYGHAEGDRVLTKLGEIMITHARPDDIVGRIGGEEFAMLLPGTPHAQAYRVAERLRAQISMPHAELPAFTASFGVTEVEGSDRRLVDAITRADRALYTAKQSGRNQTCIETGMPQSTAA